MSSHNIYSTRMEDQNDASWTVIKSKRTRRAERRKLRIEIPKLEWDDTSTNICPHNSNDYYCRSCDFCECYSKIYRVCPYLRLISCLDCNDELVGVCGWSCGYYNHYTVAKYCPCVFNVEYHQNGAYTPTATAPSHCR